MSINKFQSIQIIEVAEGTSDWVALNLTTHLRDGETIATVGTPVEQGTSDLVITQIAATDVETQMGDPPEPVDVGKGIRFFCSGWLAAHSNEKAPYIVKVPYTTSAGASKKVFVQMYAVKGETT